MSSPATPPGKLWTRFPTRTTLFPSLSKVSFCYFRLAAIADKLSEAFLGRDISRVSAQPSIFRSARNVTTELFHSYITEYPGPMNNRVGMFSIESLALHAVEVSISLTQNAG